jgi:hypothetical protein
MNEIRINAGHGTHKEYECPTGKTCLQIKEHKRENNKSYIYFFISAFVGITYMNEKYLD